MQSLQKLCPHGSVTGSVNTSRQMQQRSCSSVSRQFEADMLTVCIPSVFTRNSCAFLLASNLFVRVEAEMKDLNLRHDSAAYYFSLQVVL